jgi:hypothetical protein
LNKYDKKTFPIDDNYAGKHDLERFKVVGNIYEYEELKEYRKRVNTISFSKNQKHFLNELILPFGIVQITKCLRLYCFW